MTINNYTAFNGGYLLKPLDLFKRLCKNLLSLCLRKTLSYSKQLVLLEAACVWEDWIYNLTRSLKTLRVEVNDGQRRWQPRSPAMAAGLSDRLWSVEELLTKVVAPSSINTK